MDIHINIVQKALHCYKKVLEIINIIKEKLYYDRLFHN